MSSASEGEARESFVPSPKSLSWRIALWSALGSILVVLAVTFAMYLTLIAQVRSVDEQVLLKRALRVRDILQTEQSVQEWLGHEVSEDLEGPRQVFMRVITARSETLAETPGMSNLVVAAVFPVNVATNTAPALSSFQTANGRTFRVLTLQVEANALPTGRALIQTAVDTSVDELLLRQFRTSVFLLLPLAAVACIVLAAIIASHLLAPLRSMAKDAEGIGAHDTGRRLTAASSAAELLELAGAFNGVLQRLEQARDSLRRYADNVAHEIRTPLNRMLLNAEIAVRETRSQPEYHDILEAQIQECNALSHLAQRLLFLARAESGRQALVLEALDVGRELEVLRAYFEAGAIDAGVEIVVTADFDNLRLTAERALFQQAISNLVTNALAHTPRGGRIGLEARAERGGASILVRDTGEGIAESDLAHVFDRFYRAESQAVDAKRVGLGLAISKSILELHGGEISIESEAGHGATVRTWWPTLV